MPKQIAKLLLLALLAVIVSGCATNVQRNASYSGIDPMVLKQNPMTEITVESTEEVRTKASLKFDEDMLRKTILRALEVKDLFDAEKETAGHQLAVTVTKVRVRSTFNAVMWGAMAGADKIEGKVTLLDADGNAVDKFNVSASYALGGFAGGQDGTRMEWLYDAFAKEVVKQFLGSSD